MIDRFIVKQANVAFFFWDAHYIEGNIEIGKKDRVNKREKEKERVKERQRKGESVQSSNL